MEEKFSILSSQLSHPSKKVDLVVHDFSNVRKPTDIDPLPPFGKPPIQAVVSDAPKQPERISVVSTKSDFTLNPDLAVYINDLVHNGNNKLKALKLDLSYAESLGQVRDILDKFHNQGFISEDEHKTAIGFLGDSNK